MSCWLAENAVTRNGRPLPACDGRLIRAHLIPQQQIKRAVASMVHNMNPDAGLIESGLLRSYLADPRGFVPACGGITGIGGCHGRLDVSRTLKIPRDRLPAGVEEMAAELGLTGWLHREYGPTALERAA